MYIFFYKYKFTNFNFLCRFYCGFNREHHFTSSKSYWPWFRPINLNPCKPLFLLLFVVVIVVGFLYVVIPAATHLLQWRTGFLQMNSSICSSWLPTDRDKNWACSRISNTIIPFFYLKCCKSEQKKHVLLFFLKA